MKKIFLAAFICCVSYIANAQTKNDSVPQEAEKIKDKGAYITLQAGQLILVSGTRTEKIEKEKVLTDGTVVMNDGLIKKPDGTSMQMKEGDRIYIDGAITQSKKDKIPMKQ